MIQKLENNKVKPRDLHCKICGSSTIEMQGEIPGYQRGDLFTIYECQDCDSSFALGKNDINHSIYELIYKNVEAVPGYARYHQISKQILSVEDPLNWLKNIEGTYHSCISIIEDAFSSKRDETCIVELGCGQGYLTFALNKAGYNCYGIDISQTAISLARKRYGEYFHCGSLSDFLTNSGKKPTHIICTELIEHLEDPKEFIKSVTSAMSINTKFIITTPNKFKPTNSIWDTELPPVHLWYLTKKGVSSISRNLSLNIEFYNFDNFYSSQNSFFKKYRKSQTKFISTFDENNKLINLKAEKTVFFYLKKYITRLNPYYIFDKLIFGKKYKLIKRNDENSEFLCFTLSKRI